MGSASASQSYVLQLTFSVTHSVSFGDRVYVVGSIPELGAWDPTQAVPLKWHTNDVWSSVPVPIAPSGGRDAPFRFEYKFIVAPSVECNDGASDGRPGDAAHNANWENGANHAVDVAPRTLEAVLAHSWGDETGHDIGTNHMACVIEATARLVRGDDGTGSAAVHTTDPGTGPSASAPSGISGASGVGFSPPPTPARIQAGHLSSDPVEQAAARLASASIGPVPGNPSMPKIAAAMGSQSAAREMRIPAVFRVAVPRTHREDVLYVVGSIPELGTWNKVHAPRMRMLKTTKRDPLPGHMQSPSQWTVPSAKSGVNDGAVMTNGRVMPWIADTEPPRSDRDGDYDYWELYMVLPTDAKHMRFEYKYMVRPKGRASERTWEPGPNRIGTIQPGHGMRQGSAGDFPEYLYWNDRWNKLRCEFSIYYPAREGSVMHITGDPQEIGGWFKPGPVPMSLGSVERLETDVDGRKWRLSVWLPRSVKSFSYRYIEVNKEKETYLWEREPNRVADFSAYDAALAKQCNGTLGSSLATTTVSTTDKKDEQETFMPDNSVRFMRDVNFVASMQFDEVPPNMFVGPYPQTPEDVDAMADAGVTAVFNVQTDEDFKHRGIRWGDLTKRYDERGVKVVRFPIRDFDGHSLEERIHDAAHVVNDLINEGYNVYIHCTAGMGRAPAVAVAYLCWVRGYGLAEAVAHVKRHRPVAVPNEPVLRRALQKPF